MGGFDELKERQREMWTVGDFAEVAKRTERTAETLIDAIGVEAGRRVLDVATGTGNAAMVAAERGAAVTGLDLTPKLLGIAAERARDAGLEIELIEGDAESLPFADDSFDRVVSVYGVMFAPDQQRAADELWRVCRPGGRIGVCAWTPDGVIGQLFARLAMHLPPPPEGFQPPILWGMADRVRELFPAAAAISFADLAARFEAGSAEDWVSIDERVLGPMIMARQGLERSDWEEVRAGLVSLYEDANQADDGTLLVEPAYLQAIIDLPG